MTRLARSGVEPASDRLLAELRKSGGTRRQLARRAGVETTYAGELLLGLLHSGHAERWKRPGTRAYIWKAK